MPDNIPEYVIVLYDPMISKFITIDDSHIFVIDFHEFPKVWPLVEVSLSSEGLDGMLKVVVRLSSLSAKFQGVCYLHNVGGKLYRNFMEFKELTYEG